MQPSLSTTKGIFKHVFKSISALDKLRSKKLKESEDKTNSVIEVKESGLLDKFKGLVTEVSKTYASILVKANERLNKSQEAQDAKFKEALESKDKAIREAILKARLDDGKAVQESLQIIDEKADSILTKIPKGGILDYYVDDTKATIENLRTAKKTSDTIIKVVDEKTRYLGGGGGGVWGEILGNLPNQTDLVAALDAKLTVDEKVQYDEDSNKLSILADYGSELAPALTTGNWTLPSGRNYGTSPDRLLKDGDAVGYVGRAEPSAATRVVAGQRYKITITATVTAGSFNISIGDNPPTVIGNTGTKPISATGTYECNITARNTGKPMIMPLTDASRFEIEAFSVVAITDGTGDALIEGDTITNNLNLSGTVISERQRNIVSGIYNDYFPGKDVRFVEFITTGATTITGIGMGQVEGQELWLYNNSGSGSVLLVHQSASSAAENRIISPSSTNMYLDYGEAAILRYLGGANNRRFAFKINTNAHNYNTTNFSAFLGSLLANSGEMGLGAGNTMVRISNSAGTVKVGDADDASNRTRTTWDDNNGQIKHRFFDKETYTKADDDSVMQEFVAGDGTFTTRHKYLLANMLIEENLNGVTTDIDASALLELRSQNNTSEGHKGFLPPRMTEAERDAINSPAIGLLIVNTDTNPETLDMYTSSGRLKLTPA